MRIKTKLNINILMVIITIFIVASTSVAGMVFVKNKLIYLTKKSTPYQLRTIELQKNIQSATSELLKLIYAKTDTEFNNCKQEIFKILEEVKSNQEIILELNPKKNLSVLAELQKITDDLLQIIRKRLSAEQAAITSEQKITKQFMLASQEIQALDAAVRILQVKMQQELTNSVEKTKSAAVKLRQMNDLNTQIKEIQMTLVELINTQNAKTALIIKTKTKAQITTALQNQYFFDSKRHEASMNALITQIQELYELKQLFISDAKNEVKIKLEALISTISEGLSVLALEINKAAELLSMEYDQEISQQNIIFNNSNLANNILVENSSLVADCLSIEGMVNKLFTVNNSEQLQKIAEKLKQLLLQDLNAHGESLRKFMQDLALTEQIKSLYDIVEILQNAKLQLFSQDGIVETIKHRLVMTENADALSMQLREMLAKQAYSGKTTVNSARMEQENAITGLNDFVNSSIIASIIISFFAIVFGVAFGIWIYRSIDKPLAKINKITNLIALGDLTATADINNTDEIGELASNIDKMTKSFGAIIANVIYAVNNTVKILDQLSKEVQKSSDGAKQQFDQATQIADAADEMSQTIKALADNTASAKDSSTKANEIATYGANIAQESMANSKNVYQATLALSQIINQLNSEVLEIGDVVTVISEIANQTNLLALNAAIEAARAGENGRGFAVVADEVRKLAERTINSTAEISNKITAVQNKTVQTTKAMDSSSRVVTAITENINTLGNSLQNIVKVVDNVSNQITNIARSMQNQSVSTIEVTKNIRNTSDIAEVQQKIAFNIMNAVQEIIQSIEKVTNSTKQFKIHNATQFLK